MQAYNGAIIKLIDNGTYIEDYDFEVYNTTSDVSRAKFFIDQNEVETIVVQLNTRFDRQAITVESILIVNE